jgi:hypothetical protein
MRTAAYFTRKEFLDKNAKNAQMRGDLLRCYGVLEFLVNKNKELVFR